MFVKDPDIDADVVRTGRCGDVDLHVRICRSPGCQIRIEPNHVLCHDHWHALPDDLRSHFFQLAEEYRSLRPQLHVQDEDEGCIYDFRRSRWENLGSEIAEEFADLNRVDERMEEAVAFVRDRRTARLRLGFNPGINRERASSIRPRVKIPSEARLRLWMAREYVRLKTQEAARIEAERHREKIIIDMGRRTVLERARRHAATAERRRLVRERKDRLLHVTLISRSVLLDAHAYASQLRGLAAKWSR